MECWSNGILECWKQKTHSLNHYSITPVLQPVSPKLCEGGYSENTQNRYPKRFGLLLGYRSVFLDADGFTATFQQDHVPPNAVHLTHPLPNADDSKSARLVNGDAGFVFGKYSSLKGPYFSLLGFVNQSFQQSFSDPSPLCMI